MPKSTFILEAKERYDLDLKESWMIGNYEWNIEAGKNVGLNTIIIDSLDNWGAEFRRDSIEKVHDIFEAFYGK
jgi:FMN phosphatase YigB (HAD superfamily)